jgi:activator of HSP90 ATPase
VSNSPSSELTASVTTTASAWNQAGTWEEKDTTDWCKSQLQKRLEETTVTTTTTNDDTFQVKITTVDELNGDASVAVVSGKKRYIFDFHVKLKYEIKHINDNDDDSGAVVVAKGVVRLPDICSTHHEELEVDFDGWKKRPAPEIVEAVTAVRILLANELRAQVQQFVQDFNDMY